MKECPMCGEVMRLNEREVAVRIPDRTAPLVRHEREWVCPECDYYEDAEVGEG